MLVVLTIGYWQSAKRYLVVERESRPETLIVSEEYRWQICSGRLVVQSQGHQRHGLDDPKAILEALAKKL